MSEKLHARERDLVAERGEMGDGGLRDLLLKTDERRIHAGVTAGMRCEAVTCSQAAQFTVTRIQGQVP